MCVVAGSSRAVYYSAGVRDSITALLRSSSSFSFLTSVRQTRHNSGSLLALAASAAASPHLEIQSRWVTVHRTIILCAFMCFIN